MRRLAWRRSTKVIVWLTLAWVLSFLELVVRLPSSIDGVVAPFAWLLLYVLPIVLAVAVVYWVAEPAIDVVRRRLARRRDA